jgi:hypothetical protein
MDTQRYWIVGGEYNSMTFDDLVEGTERLVGPLPSREEAERTWREISERHRQNATVRFTIAAER